MTKNAEKVMALYMGLADEDRQEFHMGLHDYEKAPPEARKEKREGLAARAGVVLGSARCPYCGK